jgi:hypothetical protein
MTRALLFRLISIGTLCVAASACQSSSPAGAAVHTAADQRLTQREQAPEQVIAVLDLSSASEEVQTHEEQGEGELDVIEETVVAVDANTFDESAHALRFVPVTRGRETLGVRVFFNDAADGNEDDGYLGLRSADRIEEVDGLPVTSLDALRLAWHRVGWLPEVRFSVSRAGRLHTVIYRRRAPGMTASW